LSNSLSLCSSHNAIDQITYPHRTGELAVMYVVIFMLWGGTGRENILGRKVAGIPWRKTN
jgi:hypothetical protein